MNNVTNVVKGGSTVPLKFNIYDCNGHEITSTAYILYQSATVAEYNCAASPPDQVTIDVTNTGQTQLRYDGTQFIQNWQTPNNKGHCYVVRVTTIDGSYIQALFKTK
jgi:hypothetical protein